jgi:hypothetical protein
MPDIGDRMLTPAGVTTPPERPRSGGGDLGVSGRGQAVAPSA